MPDNHGGGTMETRNWIEEGTGLRFAKVDMDKWQTSKWIR